MKLFVYKDGLCDPGNKIGHAAQFGNDLESANSIEQWVKMLVASCKLHALNNYRIFVVNDNIGFEETDSIINTGEPLTGDGKRGVREINVFEVAEEVNSAFKKLNQRRRDIMDSRNRSSLRSRESEIADRVYSALESTSD